MSGCSRLSCAVVAIALCGVAVGCGSPAPGGPSAATAKTAPSATATSPSRIDACSMVEPQEISSLLGAAVAGVSTGTTADRGDCTWTNASTEESITLEIGSPDTARHDVLPTSVPDPTTPGPDGMRYLGNGEVEFAAGNRSNNVQVAVIRLSSDDANAAAVTLAREVSQHVPQ